MPTDDPTRRFQFGKSQRLLTPRDFKAVFDGASYKVSHRSMLLLAVANGRQWARLGLVVSKKNARLARQRNRIKRHLREQFRLHQHDLANLDIVALAKPGLWQLDNQGMDKLIQQQWQRLQKLVVERDRPTGGETACLPR